MRHRVRVCVCVCVCVGHCSWTEQCSLRQTHRTDSTTAVSGSTTRLDLEAVCVCEGPVIKSSSPALNFAYDFE
jgi:hypothetical protein